MKNKQQAMDNQIPRRKFVKQTAITSSVLLFPTAMTFPLFRAEKEKQVSGIHEQQVLSEGWNIAPVESGTINDSFFTNAGTEWYSITKMPAMPHKILLEHKKIDEPWKPYGMEKCYWVSQKGWLYANKFNVENTGGEQRIIFKELKGKVTVFLNGKELVTHNDQAHPLLIDITGKLKDTNELVLYFEKASPDVTPGAPDPSKRQKNGTYLGPNPRLYTCGVIGKIVLERTNGSLMNEVITDFSLDESLKKGEVKFAISGKSQQKNVEIKVQLLSPNGDSVVETKVKVQVQKGLFQANPKLQIENPTLWWPRGYGEQNLYTAKISLMVSNKPHQTEFRTIGFRKVTMPNNLHFEVNGIPVFLRGGNWVTPDLMSEVWDQQRMETLFDLAEHANFNAFRIWGQVEAPNDRFYEMADERGFLLWQDFTKMPFTNNSDHLPESVDKATKFLIRIKHHPCILLWCGINEATMWWHEDYNKEFKDNGPWPGLEEAEAVGQVCKQLDPDRYYIPSAPYGGENANEPRVGATNGYTNMWYVPGYDYLNFASEDTRISCPTLNSMEQFMLPEEICPPGYTTLALHGNENPYPDSWRVFTAAESWKKTGPVEQFYDANDAASLANRIGMAEGVYYRDIIERQRRGRPGDENSDRRCCGGYLVWKYNDSWVSIYSAKVDYFLEPYHVYYTLRDVYAPILLSFDIGIYIYLWVVNDSTKPISGTVKIQLYHLQKCEFRKEIVRDITVQPGKSKVVVRLDEAGIRAFRKEHILFAELKDNGGKVIARANALADIERRCRFPDAKLNVSVENNALIITTDKFARNINLNGNANGEKLGWLFEDNYFDLFPGEEKVVHILGRHKKGIITAKGWYSPHMTKIEWEIGG